MSTKISKAAFYFLGFFWSVTWRTCIVSFVSAFVIAFILSYLQAKENWPPEAIPYFASLSGTPVAVLALSYVIFRRGFTLKAQLASL